MTSDPRRRPQTASVVPGLSTPTPALEPAPAPAVPAVPVSSTPEPPKVEPDTTAAPSDGVVEQKSVVETNGTDGESFKLKFCTVCASNNNRSMEGHLRLAAAGYPVVSFGTGTLVRLPGPSITQPNIYPFDTSSYETMYTELEERDTKLYQANGILKMLERNRNVKAGPERWQDWEVGRARLGPHETDQGSRGVEAGVVDIVITCEERCWDSVVDDLLNRGSPLDRPVHVFNIDIKDSHEEALIGGKAIVDLADNLTAAAIEERNDKGTVDWRSSGPGRTGFDERVPDILGEWQDRWPQFPALWTLAWF